MRVCARFFQAFDGDLVQGVFRDGYGDNPGIEEGAEVAVTGVSGIGDEEVPPPIEENGREEKNGP